MPAIGDGFGSCVEGTKVMERIVRIGTIWRGNPSVTGWSPA